MLDVGVVESRDERSISNSYPVDLQISICGYCRGPPRRLQLRRHVHGHAPSSAAHTVAPVKCIVTDADDVVCVLLFQVSFCDDRNRRTVTLKFSG